MIEHPLCSTVIAGGYCIGCGACASTPASGFQLRLDEFGKYRAQPTQPQSERIDSCKEKLVCPFADGNPNEEEIAAAFYAEHCSLDEKIGYFRKCYAGHVRTGDFRRNGSSGGIVSWLGCELLNRDLIDGFIHVRARPPDQADPRLFQYAISRTAAEVIAGASSRYYPVELSRVLAEVRRVEGRYAIVGVPCFIKALRLLAMQDNLVQQRIPFHIGLVCGHLKSARFAEFLARQCGVEVHELAGFNFRKKLPDRPANRYGVEVTSDVDGSFKQIVKPTSELAGTNWGEGFFKYAACDYCDDVFAETADIVIGDAWLPEYAEDSGGTSVIVTRSRFMQQIIADGISSDALELEDMRPTRAAQSQIGSFWHRRTALAYRLFLKDQGGQWRPEKRTQPSSQLQALDRRAVRLRMELAAMSHRAYAKHRHGPIEGFLHEMQPLADRYRQVHRNRHAQPGIPAWRRPFRVARRLAKKVFDGLTRSVNESLDD